MIRPFLTLKELLSEFLSTFKEWHYFIGGVAVGTILAFLGFIWIAPRLWGEEDG